MTLLDVVLGAGLLVVPVLLVLLYREEAALRRERRELIEHIKRERRITWRISQ